MMEDDALLLRRIAWRESSFVVHLLTRMHGRIALVARGARRVKSPLRGQLEPLHHLRIGWRPSRSGMGTLLRCERKQPLLRADRWPEGLALLPVAARLFPEGTSGYWELGQALKAVQEAATPALGLLAGLWRLLHEAGLVAHPDHCWHCGAKEGPLFVAEGGLRCGACGLGAIPWREEAARALSGEMVDDAMQALARRLVAATLAAHQIRMPQMEEGRCI